MPPIDEKHDAMTLDMRLRYKRLGTWQRVADDIKEASGITVSRALCWKAANGEYSQKLARAIGLVEPRCRIAADVTPAQRNRLHEIADREGLTWSEYCQRLADNC